MERSVQDCVYVVGKLPMPLTDYTPGLDRIQSPSSTRPMSPSAAIGTDDGAEAGTPCAAVSAF